MARPIPNLDTMEAVEVAADDLIVIDDTSAEETKTIEVGKLLGLPVVGWTPSGEVHTFVSWDSATRIGVIQVPSNATTKYQAGNRYRITQATGGTKYGIIHKVTSTQLTVFFPSGTTLNNETISNPYYSQLDSPIGFDKDPELWRFVVQPVANTANTPAKVTWYKPSSTGAITYGVGAWLIDWEAAMRGAGTASTWISQKTTVSTTTNSETITEATVFAGTDMPSSGLITISAPAGKKGIRRLVSSGTETLHLLHNLDVQGSVHSSSGLNIGARLVATSAYL